MNIKGLIIREVSQGDSNKIVNILTEEYGVITATARGVKKITAKNASGVQLFSYSEFNIENRKNWNYIRSSNPIHIFYGLRDDLKKVSLASYFLQVIYECIMENQKNGEVLRLTLNTLYYLENNKRDPNLLKSIFEFRFLSEIGMMPDILICPHCGEYLPENPVFLIDEGNFYCDNCIKKIKYKKENAVLINRSILHAIRYIVLIDMDKLFSFKLTEDAQKILSILSERYLQYRLGKRFKALEFFKTVENM